MIFVIAFAPLLHAQEKDEPKKKKTQPADGLKALSHPDAQVVLAGGADAGGARAARQVRGAGVARGAQGQERGGARQGGGGIWKIDETPPSVLLPVLLDALKDKDAAVRAAAPPVIALLGAKAKPALPALKETLKDKEFDVKLAAVAALGDLGPVARGSVGDLLGLTGDPSFFLLEPFVGAAWGISARASCRR